MIRDKLMEREAIDGFRWRNHEVTRIEGFSDAVFGFAVTLLIVSLEVPRTSTELLATMRGFGSFMMTFLILAGMWYGQFTFFRRYGLEDRLTVVLNLVLLFTVLFFIYPLKFLFGALFANPFLRAKVVTDHGLVPMILPEHKPFIFAIFGSGFAAVFLVFFFLYRHAYQLRESLGLNEFEIYETRHSMQRQVIGALIGLSYFGTAWLESLPQKTARDQQIDLIGSIAVAAIYLVLFGTMIRIRLQRRKIRREWISRGGAAASPQGLDRPPDEHSSME